MLLYEFRLSIRNRLVILCLIIGVISGLPGIFSYYSDATFMWASNQNDAVSCYQAWLYMLSMSSASIYKVIVPLLIIPNLDSFFLERKYGYSNFVIVRSNYKRYFFSKLISGTITAGLILVSILVSWLIFCMMIFPGNMPVKEYTYITNSSLCNFYVNNPILYIMIIICSNFLFAVIFYSLGFGVSYFCKNRYIVITTPFLIYLTITMLSSILRIAPMSPVSLIVPHEVLGVSWQTVLIEFSIWFCISCGIVLYCFNTSRREV